MTTNKGGRPRMSSNGKVRTVAITLTPELDDAVRKVAEDEDRPLAAVARELMLLGLEQRQKGKRRAATFRRPRKGTA